MGKRKKKQKRIAKIMDRIMVGPRLFCVACGRDKVLSPCYSCQSKGRATYEEYCRGCGLDRRFCRMKYEICSLLR